MSSLRKTGRRTGREALVGLKMVGHQVEDGAAWAKLRGPAELLNPEFRTEEPQAHFHIHSFSS